MKEILKHFIIGSSLPACLITFIYNGMAFAKSGRPSSVPYEYFPIIVTALFGLWNAIMFKLSKKYKASWLPFVIGAFAGLSFSLIGRFGFDLPVKIFNFTNKTSYKVHLYAPVLYALIFGLIVHNLNKMF